MRKSKSSISKAASYKEMGSFWDTHDLSDYWDKTTEVEFDVDVKSETVFCAVDMKLAGQVRVAALKRGVSADTLINLWIQEKLKERKA
jgi:hypothetical protein